MFQDNQRRCSCLMDNVFTNSFLTKKQLFIVHYKSWEKLINKNRTYGNKKFPLLISVSVVYVLTCSK